MKSIESMKLDYSQVLKKDCDVNSVLSIIKNRCWIQQPYSVRRFDFKPSTLPKDLSSRCIRPVHITNIAFESCI